MNMRLRSNVDEEVRQQLEGKTYVWPEKGSVLTVPEKVGAWLLGKLNTPDRNPELKAIRAERGNPKFEIISQLPNERGEQQEDSSVVVAALPKKAPAVPPAAPVTDPAGNAPPAAAAAPAAKK